MRKKSNIARYTADELATMRKRGKSRTDWTKAAAISREELERSIASDPDEAGMVIDWESATIEPPQAKAVLNMRVDRHVLDFFRRDGARYQTRINAVLRAYVQAQEKQPKKNRTAKR
ncbi:MAG TPA: BrnA antitoxin family protein [Rhizomicrobium sp.]|jgi:uncharacterized protein (DUF4415 family)